MSWLEDYGLWIVIALVILNGFAVFLMIRKLKKEKAVVQSLESLSLQDTFTFEAPLKKDKTYVTLYQSLDDQIKQLMKEKDEALDIEEDIRTYALTDQASNLLNPLGFKQAINENLHTMKVVYFLRIEPSKEYLMHYDVNLTQRLIKLIAKSLRTIEDDVLVARVERFDFYLAYKDESLVDKINHLFNQAIEDESYTFSLNVRGGMSYIESDVEQALIQAKITLMHSENTIQMFKPSMHHTVKQKQTILNHVEKALDKDGFYLVYQPQFLKENQALIGVEALLRLDDDTYLPNDFIPVIEQAGLMANVSRMVVRKVCEDLLKHRLDDDHLRVYINYSDYQLDDATFMDDLKGILEEKVINPKRLGFEIKEQLFIDAPHKTKQVVQAFKDLGIDVRIVEFGSGYTGLYDLSHYLVSGVKLDKRFIEDVLTKDKLKVFKALTDYIDLLGFEIIAEGIEHEAQAKLLENSIVKIVQGYHYYKPEKMRDIVHLMQKKNN